VGKPDLDVAPRLFAGLCVTPHPQLSGKTSDICCAPSTLFSGLNPAKLFLFPKLKTTLKGRHFQTIPLSLVANLMKDCAHAQFSGCS
jgi:hypothetical protein